LVVLTQSERADITAFRPIKSTLSAVASALGFYRVPTIGANIKDTEFSRKVTFVWIFFLANLSDIFHKN